MCDVSQQLARCLSDCDWNVFDKGWKHLEVCRVLPQALSAECGIFTAFAYRSSFLSGVSTREAPPKPRPLAVRTTWRRMSATRWYQYPVCKLSLVWLCPSGSIWIRLSNLFSWGEGGAHVIHMCLPYSKAAVKAWVPYKTGTQGKPHQTSGLWLAWQPMYQTFQNGGRQVVPHFASWPD